MDLVLKYLRLVISIVKKLSRCCSEKLHQNYRPHCYIVSNPVRNFGSDFIVNRNECQLHFEKGKTAHEITYILVNHSLYVKLNRRNFCRCVSGDKSTSPTRYNKNR